MPHPVIAKDNVDSPAQSGSETLPLLGLIYSGTKKRFSIVTEPLQTYSRRAANSA